MDNENNEVFIGARALKDQINLILPTYNLLIEQIEQIRSVAKNRTEIESKKEHNNTIGIFGERGTGKTSALYTIMEQLKENKDANIILPIIEPDNFGENTKIMGSIIGFLSDTVEEELKEIKKITNSQEKNKLSDYFNNCIFKENNPLKLKRDELIEYHLYTENEYRTLLTHNFDDTATHIKKSSYLLTPDIRFKEKLTNLVDLIIEIRKKLSKSNLTPLIYIFIDDIDLKTTKCKELIDSILQYANHANIVTILSGDYEILKESITLALVSDENLSQSNLSPKCRVGNSLSILDRKKYLTNEYLKKIIPPVRRHNVVKWNIKTIPNFAFGEKTLAIQLDELLSDNNFFGYRNGDKVMPIKYCYSIFDRTPRGLVNVYYHIHQIIKYKNQMAQNMEDLFKNVKLLIDTIMTSSRELVDEQKKFFDECLLWGDSAKSTYINYKKLIQYEESLEKKTYKINKNLFNFFIICELLKELIKDIVYDKNDYKKCKKLILQTIYLDPKNKKVNDIIDAEGNFVNKKNVYIYNILLEIAYNTNFKSALLLLEYLTESEFGEEYGYEQMDEDKYLKNRNIFIAICKLIKQNSDSNLLKQLNLKNYEQNSWFVGRIFEFLNNICSTSQEFSITEKLFKPFIEKSLKFFNSDGLQSTIIKNLFINTLTVIYQKSDEEVEKYLIKLNKENPHYKQYKTIKNSINKIEKSTQITDERSIERWKNNVNKVMDRLSGYVNELLKANLEYRLAVVNNNIFLQEKDTIINEKSGSEKTKYSKLKKEIQDKETSYFIYNRDINNTKNDYGKIYSYVLDLSCNSRVWYGRQESYKFLEMLKQQFYFQLSLFEDMIPVIHELGIYLKSSNLKMEEDNSFEEYKIYMKAELDKAFKEAMGDFESDLEEMGSSLEEDEMIIEE